MLDLVESKSCRCGEIVKNWMTFARPTSTHCNGKQMQAAAALDIDRVTLHNKLKGWKYGWKWITAEA